MTPDNYVHWLAAKLYNMYITYSVTTTSGDNEELVKLTPFICEETSLPESQVAELQIVEKEAEK